MNFRTFVLLVCVISSAGTVVAEIVTRNGQKYYTTGDNSYFLGERSSLTDDQIAEILGLAKLAYETGQNSEFLRGLWGDLNVVYQGDKYGEIMILILRTHLNQLTAQPLFGIRQGFFSEGHYRIQPVFARVEGICSIGYDEGNYETTRTPPDVTTEYRRNIFDQSFLPPFLAAHSKIIVRMFTTIKQSDPVIANGEAYDLWIKVVASENFYPEVAKGLASMLVGYFPTEKRTRLEDICKNRGITLKPGGSRAF